MSKLKVAKKNNYPFVFFLTINLASKYNFNVKSMSILIAEDPNIGIYMRQYNAFLMLIHFNANLCVSFQIQL